MAKYDVAIIGGGVIGAFCARELMRYSISVLVLEANEEVASGASRANSGIVHAGFDAPSGTLKAKFNLMGNELMENVCAELGVKFIRNGSLVLAEKEQKGKLEDLLERGIENGVRELEILTREDLLRKEANIGEKIEYGLYAPTGGIVSPYGLTIAALGNAMDNGAELKCGFSVEKTERSIDGWKLVSARGEEVEAKFVVNSAGYRAEKTAKLFGDDSFGIGARKGEYMLLDKTAGGYVRHTVFSVPTAAGKGVLVTPTADGNILVGPTSVEEDRYDTEIRRKGFEEIRAKAGRILKEIPFGETITSFAGVRAYSDSHDFIIEFSEKAEGLMNVAGIESPGLTSAPAIGKYVSEKIVKRLRAEKNQNFNPKRKSNYWFREMSEEEKNEVIRRKPEYGKTICRCEGVTAGEILEALRENPRAHTLDGIKLRTRAGMGRCQSGFCQPSVFNMLMSEYGYKAEEVTKNGGKSYVIVGGEI